MKIGIIGMGWFGRPFAQFCVRNGHDVMGTKRKPRASLTALDGIEVLPFEFENCEPSQSLSRILDFSDIIVFDIPPSAVAPNVFEKNLKSIATKICDSKIKKAIFLSSTSVFSNDQGQVNEETVPSPESQNGKLLLQLEQIWTSIINPNGIVVRPGGLIGQDRHPVKYLSGREGLKGHSAPINLVHQDDLVKLVFSIATNKASQTIFHAVANQHPNKMEYYQKVAERRGMPIPRFDENDTSEGKTVDAENSKQILGVKFDYENPFEM